MDNRIPYWTGKHFRLTVIYLVLFPWSLDSPSPTPHPISLSRAFTAWFFWDLSCARCLVFESDCPGLGFHARRSKRHKRFVVEDFLFAESDCSGQFPVSESNCPGLGFHTRRGKRHKRFLCEIFCLQNPTVWAGFRSQNPTVRAVSTSQLKRETVVECTDRRTHML